LCVVDLDVLVKFDGPSHGTGENENEGQGRVQWWAIERHQSFVCYSTGYIITFGPPDEED